jgi:sulfoxide reductase heme-binding subunit YedZ
MAKRTMVWVKVAVHGLCALPAVWLACVCCGGALRSQDDPATFLQHRTGEFAIWMLMAALAVTPLRRLHVALTPMVRLRRLVGLWAFFYASVHVVLYVLLFSGYDMAAATAGLRAGHLAEPWVQLKLIWPAIVDDVETRRFIQAGLVAYVILLALAVTSPQRVLAAMGGRWWQRLHRLVYVAGFAAVAHFWWQMKPGVTTPAKVTVVLWALLLARVVYWAWRRWKLGRTSVAPQA